MALLSGSRGAHGNGGAAGTYIYMNKENSDELYAFVKTGQLTNFTLTTAKVVQGYGRGFWKRGRWNEWER